MPLPNADLASDACNPRNSAFLDPIVIVQNMIADMSDDSFEAMISCQKMTKWNENRMDLERQSCLEKTSVFESMSDLISIVYIDTSRQTRSPIPWNRDENWYICLPLATEVFLRRADVSPSFFAVGSSDLGQEWIASSRHPRLPQTSAICSNQGIDKISHASQLKIRDEPLICPMTPI
jgi:hypothetical protein